MIRTLFYISFVAATPVPSHRDSSLSHRQTFTHSLVGGVGVGAGATAGALAVNGIVDHFKGDGEKEKGKDGESKGESVKSNDQGCTPGKVIIISTPTGPQKGIIASDCSVAQIA